MLRYTAGRLSAAIPLALGAATLVFVLLEAAPGEPLDLMLADRPVSPEIRERLERAWGLDRTPAERYLDWMGALLLHGDLGWSHSRSRPVSRLLAEALPPTLALAGTALAIHLLAGLALGLVSAARPGCWLDRAITAIGLTLYAMPTFWLALMAVLVFSSALDWLPASSMTSVGAAEMAPLARTGDLLLHLVLPAGVLGLGSAAAMTRFVRSGALESLERPYVRAARARGASGSRVLLAHALRNALLPVINLVGLSLPVLLSGSLVIKVVFAWPGMGRLTYDAIRAQDFPVVQATTLVATAAVVAGSLAADLAMGLADPRLRPRALR
jgi:peptide/nickel transport system permease protein